VKASCFGESISAGIVIFDADVSVKDIPRYQAFLEGVLACRFQKSEAAMGNSAS
jgi:hypothetical protein